MAKQNSDNKHSFDRANRPIGNTPLHGHFSSFGFPTLSSSSHLLNRALLQLLWVFLGSLLVIASKMNWMCVLHLNQKWKLPAWTIFKKCRVHYEWHQKVTSQRGERKKAFFFLAFWERILCIPDERPRVWFLEWRWEVASLEMTGETSLMVKVTKCTK